MKNREDKNRLRSLTFVLTGIGMVIVLLLGGMLYSILGEQAETQKAENEVPDVSPALLPDVKDGIHQPTGFVADKGLALVIANCTNCHSAKLVTQNRATREGWLGMIQWMQATQNLWDLGENEEIIVNYLARHYAPTYEGRRRNLQDVEWYTLDSAGD